MITDRIKQIVSASPDKIEKMLNQFDMQAEITKALEELEEVPSKRKEKEEMKEIIHEADFYKGYLKAIKEKKNGITPQKVWVNGNDHFVCLCGGKVKQKFKYCPECGKKLNWGC